MGNCSSAQQLHFYWSAFWQSIIAIVIKVKGTDFSSTQTLCLHHSYEFISARYCSPLLIVVVGCSFFVVVKLSVYNVDWRDERDEARPKITFEGVLSLAKPSDDDVTEIKTKIISSLTFPESWKLFKRKILFPFLEKTFLHTYPFLPFNHFSFINTSENVPIHATYFDLAFYLSRIWRDMREMKTMIFFGWNKSGNFRRRKLRRKKEEDKWWCSCFMGFFVNVLHESKNEKHQKAAAEKEEKKLKCTKNCVH